MWVLDISGQYLGAGCIVGVFVRPSGAVLGNINLLEYTFVLNICSDYACIWATGGIFIYQGKFNSERCLGQSEEMSGEPLRRFPQTHSDSNIDYITRAS